MTPREPPDVNGERPPQPLSNESVATHDDQESLGVRVATTTGKAASNAPGEPVAAQLRRRRAAALRSVPLPDGFRDPFDRLASPPGPSDFGLDRADLSAEVDRCIEIGWADWELVVRFVDPRLVAA
jgi:hypothetical protein